MALQRANPLPPGVYWQDFFNPPVGGASIKGFEAWLRANANTVKLRSSTFHGRGAHPLQAFMQGAWTLNPALALIANAAPQLNGPERLWALFEVLAPTTWPAQAFGFPTIASITTVEADTVQRPPPEKEGFEVISDAASAVAKGVADVGGSIVTPVLLGLGLVLGGALVLKAMK